MIKKNKKNNVPYYIFGGLAISSGIASGMLAAAPTLATFSSLAFLAPIAGFAVSLGYPLIGVFAALSFGATIFSSAAIIINYTRSKQEARLADKTKEIEGLNKTISQQKNELAEKDRGIKAKIEHIINSDEYSKWVHEEREAKKAAEDVDIGDMHLDEFFDNALAQPAIETCKPSLEEEITPNGTAKKSGSKFKKRTQTNKSTKAASKQKESGLFSPKAKALGTLAGIACFGGGFGGVLSYFSSHSTSLANNVAGVGNARGGYTSDPSSNTFVPSAENGIDSNGSSPDGHIPTVLESNRSDDIYWASCVFDNGYNRIDENFGIDNRSWKEWFFGLFKKKKDTSVCDVNSTPASALRIATLRAANREANEDYYMHGNKDLNSLFGENANDTVEEDITLQVNGTPGKHAQGGNHTTALAQYGNANTCIYPGDDQDSHHTTALAQYGNANTCMYPGDDIRPVVNTEQVNEAAEAHCPIPINGTVTENIAASVDGVGNAQISSWIKDKLFGLLKHMPMSHVFGIAYEDLSKANKRLKPSAQANETSLPVQANVVVKAPEKFATTQTNGTEEKPAMTQTSAPTPSNGTSVEPISQPVSETPEKSIAEQAKPTELTKGQGCCGYSPKSALTAILASLGPTRVPTV